MTVLRVTEIFDSLQGEGYWSGVPMTFVRLAGCNARELGLGCVAWCDTPGSWNLDDGREMGVALVAARACLPRLCLTGGEPLLQAQGVAELVDLLHESGVRVHLETNGTVDSLCDFDWVTVSPKPPDYPIAAGWPGRIDELKLIVDDSLDAATAERLAAAHPGAIICLQPRFEGLGGPGAQVGRTAPSAADRAVDMVMSHPDWRLSLQMHRYLGIR
ncbi:MAG: 7-carboxy-7-deazaguanine synthase QueE [Actinobacteria bacterium]|nr:7-carboxy-7-deazaguanine synthase QueE [Actinomycetota bacterium]